MPSPQLFTATLKEKKRLTDSVLFLSFIVPESFTFKAGQFVSIQFEDNGQRKLKSYSILNPPSKKGVVDLCVKIIAGGFASSIFMSMSPGMKLQMHGPFGHFLFDEMSSHPEHWFVGAGTGITPLYSIIKEFVEMYPQKQFVLLMGFRNQIEILFYEELLTMEKQYPHFKFIPTLSQEQWEGKLGRVQKHLEGNLKNKIFYICGLKELVLETKEYLVQQGVEAKDIHFERYS